MVILWHRGCVPKYSNLNLNFKFKFEPLIVAEGSRAFGHTLLSGVIVVSGVIGIKWRSNGFIFASSYVEHLLVLIFDDWKNSAAKTFLELKSLLFCLEKSGAEFQNNLGLAPGALNVHEFNSVQC